jgi:NTP pyrophosphatase (non-canonical NTP hydrolase)
MGDYEVSEWQRGAATFVLDRMSPKTFDSIPHTMSPLIHAALGLAGEAGEFGDLVKKVAFGKASLDEVKPKMQDELADLIFYLVLACEYADVELPGALAHLKTKLSKGHGWHKSE